MSEKNDTKSTQEEPITFKYFLENIPPGKLCSVNNVLLVSSKLTYPKFIIPQLHLYCDNEFCKGFRYFEFRGDDIYYKSATDLFLNFWCKNCARNYKTYAIRVSPDQDPLVTRLLKFGEIPQFGPPLPPKLISMIGPDKEYFLKGRRSENQGLGIAAFAYYRRVVENQKNRIFDEIIKVHRTLNSPIELINELVTAESETQFSKAVQSIKHAIPQALLIDGHNPLLLLHSALSEGLHEDSDDNCLELATSIRIILSDLSERLAQILKDKKELKDAVSRLIKKKSKEN